MRVIVSGEYRAFLIRPSRNFLPQSLALENLLPVRVAEPHDPDRPALGALDRVIREDLRLRGLLEFDPRGNPELDREGVLAHLNLVCSRSQSRGRSRPKTCRES